MSAVDKLLDVARAEIGYLEKASNSQLDSKTSNAGDKNYTKYARDMDNIGMYNGKKNGYAWCDMFCDWCFATAFGVEKMLKMTGQKKGGYGAGCTESVKYYKAIGRFYKSNPKPGDQIFFSKDGGKNYYHTGLVERVENGKVYTIEGNTSSTSGVVENGGAVCRKSYSLSYAKIGGYGRPDYSIVEDDDIMTGKEIYDALNDYLSKQPVPAWADKELKEAVALGITDGKNPMQLIPRYQAAIMAKRIAQKK